MSNYICIDLGASSTRVAAKDKLVHEIPNNVRAIHVDEDIHMAAWESSTYEESVLNMLDVTVRRHEGENQFIPAEQRFLVGKIADRYGSSSRPSGMEPKFRQPINYRNALLATAFEILMSPEMSAQQAMAGMAPQMIGMAPQAMQVAPIPVTLFIALPPIECKGNEKILQENLKGTYTVTFNGLNTQVTFCIGDVKCNAESLLSLIHFFFAPTGMLRPESIKYRDGNTLSLDIGASTTDIAVMVNGKYIEKTGYTIPIGGNQIRDFVMNEVQLMYGYMPTIDEVDFIIRTGTIRQGAVINDFSHVLLRAKQEFAIQLIDRLNGYFKQISMSLASFMCITVGGGGSLHSCTGSGENEKITTPALSSIIMDELHKQCPTVDVLSVPGNPRYANVNGLLVFAQTWEQRMAVARR